MGCYGCHICMSDIVRVSLCKFHMYSCHTKGGIIAYYGTYKQCMACGQLRHLARTLCVPAREWCPFVTVQPSAGNERHGTSCCDNVYSIRCLPGHLGTALCVSARDSVHMTGPR